MTDERDLDNSEDVGLSIRRFKGFGCRENSYAILNLLENHGYYPRG